MEYGLIAAWMSLVAVLYVLVAVYLVTRYMVRSCMNRAPPPVRLEVVVVDDRAKLRAAKEE